MKNIMDDRLDHGGPSVAIAIYLNIRRIQKVWKPTTLKTHTVTASSPKQPRQDDFTIPCQSNPTLLLPPFCGESYSAGLYGVMSSSSSRRPSLMRSLQIPNHFYGRADELQQLSDAFRRPTEKAEMVLVGGYAGTGRSRLIAEFQKLSPDNIIFLSGKFDELCHDPYSALLAALDEWCQSFGLDEVPLANEL